MMCSWKTNDIVLGLIILIFALWQTMASKWIIVIAAAILVLHALIRHPHKEDMQMNTSIKKKRL
ncbi:MAG: hypothetical protein AABY22_32265 [Nanoarchaeota archaeon]